MSGATVIYETNGPLATIRLNRPHRLNAVVEALYDEVLAALELAESDKAVRAIIMRGEGRAFCVGADLKEHATNSRTAFEKRQYLIKANNVCARIRSISKPVIAAVNGYALGAGAELAVSADFIIMKNGAQIGFPEISIGTFIGGGVSHVLPQLVGMTKARELIFTGRRVAGREAVQIGLATRSFEDDAFQEGVTNLATDIARKAPLSMALAKSHLNSSVSTPYSTALATELEGITACMTTKDWQEGIDAFSEKRPPIFHGK